MPLQVLGKLLANIWLLLYLSGPAALFVLCVSLAVDWRVPTKTDARSARAA